MSDAASTKTQKPSKGKKDGKRKRDAGPVASSSAAFSLLGGSTDASMDDLFGKSSAFATVLPTPPTLAAPKATTEPKSKKGKEREVAIAPQPAKKAKVSTLPKVASKPAPPPSDGSASAAEAILDEGESDVDPSDLVHETVTSSKAKKPKVKAQKYTPPDETPADRARRTVFIGNLPLDCAEGKRGERQLAAQLQTFAPSAKIESIRFRSIPFSTPTAGVPGEDEDGGKRKRREIGRALAWRSEQEKLGKGGRDAEEADRAKTFLDANGKRKVAFIKKDFHEEAGTCNAYAVFGHPHPDRPKNVAPITDPYEAAALALKANGSVFMDRTIRVDTLREQSKVALQTATTALSRRDAWLPSGTDPKRSVFVGGLDYAAKEQDVRAFFEALIVAERGPAPERWVQEVRIVRDKDTQMGKGFGYVHFTDRESVDEILAVDPAKLKFAKKPLRVQPSKTLPTPLARVAPEKTEKKVPRVVPKGNPELGEKLKDLSKDDRKAAKSADAERQARRLAKKQKRVAMRVEEKGAVKLGPTKPAGRKVDKAKKGRVRSAHALTKMKGSRA